MPPTPPAAIEMKERKQDGGMPIKAQPSGGYRELSPPRNSQRFDNDNLVKQRMEMFLNKKRRTLELKNSETFRSRVKVDKNPFFKCVPVFRPSDVHRWDSVLLVAIIYVAVVIPFEASVVKGINMVLYGIGWLIDIIFICDIFVNFNLGYWKNKNEFVGAHGTGYLEMRRMKIASRYFRTWFILDLASVLPFDEMVSGSPNVSALRLLKLLKLLRVFRLGRIIDRWAEFLLRFNLLAQNLIRLAILAFLVSHWGACFWVLVGKSRFPDQGIGWVRKAEEEYGGEFGTWDLYARALHWSVMTLTTIGYGDIATPQNTVEFFFSAFFMLIVGAVWTFIIGTASSMSSLRFETDHEFILILDDLNRFMDDHDFDPKLRKQLRLYFLKDKFMRAHQRWLELLPRMSPGLQRRVSQVAHGKLLRTVPYLENLSDNCIKDLAMYVKFAMYPPSEYIGQETQVLTHALGYDHGRSLRCSSRNTLFIVVKGCVMTSDMKLKPEGGHWGEDMVLDSSWLRNDPRAISLTYVEVAMLHKVDMMAVLRKYPEDRQKLRKQLIKMAIRRNFVHEARRIKRSRSELKRGHSFRGMAQTGHGHDPGKDDEFLSTTRFEKEISRNASYLAQELENIDKGEHRVNKHHHVHGKNVRNRMNSVSGVVDHPDGDDDCRTRCSDELHPNPRSRKSSHHHNHHRSHDESVHHESSRPSRTVRLGYGKGRYGKSKYSAGGLTGFNWHTDGARRNVGGWNSTLERDKRGRDVNIASNSSTLKELREKIAPLSPRAAEKDIYSLEDPGPEINVTTPDQIPKSQSKVRPHESKREMNPMFLNRKLSTESKSLDSKRSLQDPVSDEGGVQQKHLNRISVDL